MSDFDWRSEPGMEAWSRLFDHLRDPDREPERPARKRVVINGNECRLDPIAD